MATTRVLYGGSLEGSVVVWGPAFKAGYPTVRLGDADEIRVAEGEVAVQLFEGGPSDFARYLVGRPGAVRWELLRQAEEVKNGGGRYHGKTAEELRRLAGQV
jgi:hypothetical protein